MKTNFRLLMVLFVFIGFGNSYAQTSIRPAQLVAKMKQSHSIQTVDALRKIEPTQVNARTQQQITNFTEFQLEKKSIYRLTEQNNPFIELTIPLQNETIELELVLVDIYEGKKYIITQPENKKISVDIGKHYRGIVKNDPTSLVAISIFDDEINGFVSTRNKADLYIEKQHGSENHIIYRSNDLLKKFNKVCNTVQGSKAYDKEVLQNPIYRQAMPSSNVRLYIETDYDIYQKKGYSENKVAQYMTSIFNQMAVVYANEDIPIVMSPLNVWTSESPYKIDSLDMYEYLQAFEDNKGAFDGDLAQLVTFKTVGGGLAYVDGLCQSNNDLQKSVGQLINTATIPSYPTYSWNVSLMAHEFGHLFGSYHTHACVWNGNGTAIDSCPGYTEGDCPEPTNPDEGTMMSYCDQKSGIIMSKGFGAQPGNVIRNAYSNAVQNGCIDAPAGGDTTPPSKPTNLKASNVTSSSVELTWNESTDNVQVKQYFIYQGSTKVKTASINKATITGLSANTNYIFRVKAVDTSDNASEYSNSVNIKTSEDFSCTKNTITVVLNTDKYPSETSWEIKQSNGSVVASGNPTKKLTRFEENLCLNDGCYTFTIKDSQGDGICCDYGNGSFKVIVNGKTVANGGEFTSSDSKEFCLGDGDTSAPTVPKNLTATSITTKSVNLSWSSSTDNIGVEGYILYKNNAELSKTKNTTFSVNDLLPNTTYTFNVKAYDKAGNLSKASNSLNIKTKKQSTSCDKNTLVVRLTTDQYGSETSWEITNESNKVVASGNNYGEKETYNIESCLPNGCYTFTIKDAYGDGICCKYGDGSYQVKLNGQVIASGSEFKKSESKEFCAGEKPTDPDEPTDPKNYCSLKGTNTSYEWIESVKINETENRSGSDNGYGNYINKVFNVNIGKNTISGTPGFQSTAYSEYWYLWIDLNHDGTFSANELVASGRGTGKNATTADFNIPASAKAGQTRMRVAMKSSRSTDSCGSFTYGEVEDYTANISSTSTTRRIEQTLTATVYPNPVSASNSFTISTNENIHGQYTISDSLGNIIKQGNFSQDAKTISTRELAKGVYIISITSENNIITKRFVIQ